MKKCILTAALAAILGLFPLLMYGEQGDLLLGDLAAEKELHEGKRITMTLKFKYLDRLFGKIYFYDRKNFDIVFDMTLQASMDEYRTEILNLHEGMDYRVVFLFNGVGNVGLINGELISFSPAILEKIPEAGRPKAGDNK